MGTTSSCCIGEDDNKLLVTKLDLSHCGCKEVPNIVFISERCIEVLCLSSNEISSLPPQLFHCQELKHLDLSDNYLCSIPEAIGSLVNLVSLDLDKNNVKSLPENMKKCRKLQRLSLNNNVMHSLPNTLTQMINIQEINLNNCSLKFLPASIGRLNNLKMIELRNNNLCNLPMSFSRLNQLIRLDMGGNELGTVPECIQNLHSLKELYLDNNDIEELNHIHNLTHLQDLDVSFNQVSHICDGIGNCHSLHMLNLSHNLIETLPDTIEHLRQLEYVNLENNDINVLTPSIGKLVKLQDLNISNNQLNNLPNTMGLLRNLKCLNVSNNMIEELPSEIGSCLSLSILNVSYNRLQLLPSDIAYLVNLKVLNLIGNFLMYLPISINNLVSLKAIWLSSNQNVPLIPFILQDSIGLTNIMLPQIGERLDEDYKNNKNYNTGATQRKIRFAEETDDEDSLPCKLHRTPTPFPKELRMPSKKFNKNDVGVSRNNENYVNIIDGKVFDEEDILQPATAPVTRDNSGLLHVGEGSISVIREANIRKNDKEHNRSCSDDSTKCDSRHQKSETPLDNKNEVRKDMKNGEEYRKYENLTNLSECKITVEEDEADGGNENNFHNETEERDHITNIKDYNDDISKTDFTEKIKYFEMKNTKESLNRIVQECQESQEYNKPQYEVGPDERYPQTSVEVVQKDNLRRDRNDNINACTEEKEIKGEYSLDPQTVRQMYQNDIILTSLGNTPCNKSKQDEVKTERSDVQIYQNTRDIMLYTSSPHFEFESVTDRQSQNNTPPCTGYREQKQMLEKSVTHPSFPVSLYGGRTGTSRSDDRLSQPSNSITERCDSRLSQPSSLYREETQYYNQHIQLSRQYIEDAQYLRHSTKPNYETKILQHSQQERQSPFQGHAYDNRFSQSENRDSPPFLYNRSDSLPSREDNGNPSGLPRYPYNRPESRESQLRSFENSYNGSRDQLQQCTYTNSHDFRYSPSPSLVNGYRKEQFPVPSSEYRSYENGNNLRTTGEVPRNDSPADIDRKTAPKVDMASLTERMRSRNMSPPCYEIAKMYSTKAALFQHHQPENTK